jgi:hypothetical protein
VFQQQGNMNGRNGMNLFQQHQHQPNQSGGMNSGQVTSGLRRLSVNLFQQVSDDLLRNPPPQATLMAESSSPSTGPPSNNFIVNPNSTNYGNMMPSDSDMEEHDLDHLFDDDIESIDEPVALEHSSPYIRNDAISPTVADEMLRHMLGLS